MGIKFLEPHPSHTTPSTYISSGRGGAGNLAAYTPSALTNGATASGPASLAPLDRVRSSSLARTPTHNSQLRRKSTASSVWSNGSASSTSSTRSQVLKGRGGAGNAVNREEMAVYDFEAELEAATRRANEKRIVHVGIGGQGNAFKTGGSRNSSRTAAAGDEKVQGAGGWKARVGRMMSRE